MSCFAKLKNMSKRESCQISLSQDVHHKDTVRMLDLVSYTMPRCQGLRPTLLWELVAFVIDTSWWKSHTISKGQVMILVILIYILWYPGPDWNIYRWFIELRLGMLFSLRSWTSYWTCNLIPITTQPCTWWNPRSLCRNLNRFVLETFHVDVLAFRITLLRKEIHTWQKFDEICLYFNSNQWKPVTSNRKYMCIHLLYYFTWSSSTNNVKPFRIPHPTAFLFPAMRSGLGCGWSKDEIPKRLGTET